MNKTVIKSVRVSKENFLWMKKNNISPTKVFGSALEKLMEVGE